MSDAHPTAAPAAEATAEPTGEPAARAPASPARAARLWIELLALYGVVPYIIDFHNQTVGRMLIPGLMAAGLVLFLLLRRDPTFDRTSLWNFAAFKRELPRILITACLAFLVMLGVAWWVAGQTWAPTANGEVMVRPLALLDRSPGLLLAIAFLYPLFSVYPQEIILRTWFFHRYAPIVGTGLGAVVASALVFAWVHVLFVGDRSQLMQWMPVFLCVPGGLLFGYTYWKTKSTMASGIEHAIVGNLMWLAGLGWFFFAGAVAMSDAGG